MIDFVTVNPDAETLKIILWLAGSIIGLLLTLVAWLTEKQITNQRKKIEEIQEEQDGQLSKMNAVVSSLLEAVNNLKTIVEVIKEQQADRNPRTENMLNEHEKRLDRIDVRLAKVETAIEK